MVLCQLGYCTPLWRVSAGTDWVSEMCLILSSETFEKFGNGMGLAKTPR